MNNILEVSGINKNYDDFSFHSIYQRDVSLDLWESTGQVRQPLYEVF